MLRETSKTKTATLFASFLSLAIILMLSACGGSSASATVTSVVLSPTSGNVDINTSFDISANVNLSNNTVTTSTAVTWQVNGVGGGNSTVGTIVNSPDDSQVGIYTAPGVAPSTNNGQVMITATAPQDPSNTTDTNVVTSNIALITVGVGQGFQVSPVTATVVAGQGFQFSALLNSVTDSNATWAVSSTAADCTTSACLGTIDTVTGAYVAPPAPPPGATVTVTATDATVNPALTATATVTIGYSDLSLSGPFAFSYSGNDQTGFLAVAGSFATDGNGHIVSGIEDVDSFTTGGWVQYQISSNSSTYKVGADGRGTILLNSGIPGAATLQFALTSNQHAVVTRFDRTFTGSGTLDQQNLNDTSNLSAITGPYVFTGSGANLSFLPLAIAGKFTASGNSTLQTGTGVVDLNDHGVVKQDDTSLTVSYSLDNTAPDTGRGKLTLTSTNLGQRQYAFYVVDATHLYLVEIDDNDYLSGAIYSGAPGNSFSTASLTAGNYAFTAGGNSSGGAYDSGGVFTSSGTGSISGGVFDTNNAGTVTSNSTLSTCSYTVDASTGRIVLNLCPASPSNVQFAMYQTAQGSSTAVAPSAVMLELDSTAVSSGASYLQKVTTQPASGSFALLLEGQGVFHNEPASYQQNVSGQLNFGTSNVSSGSLDINNFNAVFVGDPVSSTTSSITAPAGIGRGTALLSATNPNVSYNLAYYVIDANTALLFDLDTNRVLIGGLARQF